MGVCDVVAAATCDLYTLSARSRAEASHAFLFPSAPMTAPNPLDPCRTEVARIFENLYAELQRIAEYLLPRSPMASLTRTELTHEAFRKLVQEDVRRRTAGRSDLAAKPSAEFTACFAAACRDVLVDHARRRSAAKRGGKREREPIESISPLRADHDLEVLTLDDEIRLLATKNPDVARLVELRLFAPSTLKECAEILGVSESTVDRLWRFAKAWLKDRMERHA